MTCTHLWHVDNIIGCSWHMATTEDHDDHKAHVGDGGSWCGNVDTANELLICNQLALS